LWPGYTVPAVGKTAGDILLTNETLTYTTDLVTAKTPFISTPEGKSAILFAFQGINQRGAILPSGNTGIEGRLLDQDDLPITDWVQINGVYDAPLITIQNSIANKVRAEVRMQYDGSTITANFKTTDDFQSPATDHESPLPNSPPLFVGFEVYFGPTFTVTDLTAPSTMTTATLTLLAANTIKTPAGLPAGDIKRIDGSDGGTVKTYSGSGWN
jgi:hypothetical protein